MTLTPEMEEKKWKPGQSGNPKGRPKKRPFADKVEELLEKNPEMLEGIALQALSKAQSGDQQALKLVSERLDGKPAQQLIHSGDEDNPMLTVNKIELVGVSPAKD